jgi:hypothetical protein
MRILYFEPFCGISGDMTVGALLDLGVDLDYCRDELGKVALTGYALSSRKVVRCGIEATKFDVHPAQVAGRHEHPHSGEHPHRSFRDIRALIESSGLSGWVKERSLGAFRRLAEAEGKIHGRPPDDVEFHEVGALDSIVDIVGTMIALESLQPARLVAAPVNVGGGTIDSQHGRYPVPAPATQELLRGAPTYSSGVETELTTPTGAALLATLVEDYRPRPLMKIASTGYGAGSRELEGIPNVLRITIGDEVADCAPGPEEEVVVLEATIDDMSPQVYGYFQEKAFEAGALDVYATPVQMKKNRPGLLVTVVAAAADIDRLARLVFQETTTIGVRYAGARRKTLERRSIDVETEYGKIRVKVSLLDGRPVNYVPEYEDCRRLARETGSPLKEIQAAATRRYLDANAGRSNE